MKIKTKTSHPAFTPSSTTPLAPTSQDIELDAILTHLRALTTRVEQLEDAIAIQNEKMERDLQLSKYEATKVRVAEAVADLMSKRSQ